MLKEIYEQPKVVKDNISSRFSDDGKSIKLDGIKLGKKELENINRIYIVACGTAFYAGQVGKFLIERIARIPVNSEVASEFRYKDPLIDEHTLMIVVSQSGETADTLAAMRLAQSKGARVLGVVNAMVALLQEKLTMFSILLLVLKLPLPLQRHLVHRL